MTTNELMCLRSKIEESLTTLEAFAATARSELRASSDVSSNVLQDSLDCARDEVDLKTAVEIHNYNIIEQNSLRGALVKMSEGTFGVCRSCENLIGARRLEALPGATQCFDCQQRVEFIESTLAPQSKLTHRENRARARSAA